MSRKPTKKPARSDLSARLVPDESSSSGGGGGGGGAAIDEEDDDGDSPVASANVASASASAVRSSAAMPKRRGGSPIEIGGGASASSGTSSAAHAGVGGAVGIFASMPHYRSAAFASNSGSSASSNVAHNSSLSSGHRDLELVDLQVSRGHDAEAAAEVVAVHMGAADDEDSKVMHSALASGDEDDEPRGGGRQRKDGPASNASPGGSGSGGGKVWPSVLRDGWKTYLLRSCKAVFLSSKLNILLLAVPFAILARIGGWGDAPLFVLSLIGLCPLAERISFVTDEMSQYTNDTLGGLLSATMGNATEMIVSFFALKSGLLRIVQLSLLGSIYSNLLLVQGTAFLVGGFRFNQQSYSKQAAKTNISLLLLAVLSLMLPCVLIASSGSTGPVQPQRLLIFNAAGQVLNETAIAEAAATANAHALVAEGITQANELALSRFAAVLMLLVYALLILYQLKTHAHLFQSQAENSSSSSGGDGQQKKKNDGDRMMDAEGGAVSTSDDAEDAAADDDQEEEEPPVLGPAGSIVWALIVTLFISLLSEFIVSAIDGAAVSLGFPVLFIATILLPIVGNAAEHAAAIIFASRNKMDIALGISIGSSTQIALFVVPLMVVLGWMSGHPLSLDFQAFETVSLLLTVIMSSIILSTGKSDWLYGVMMITAYAIIAAAFWLQTQPDNLE